MFCRCVCVFCKELVGNIKKNKQLKYEKQMLHIGYGMRNSLNETSKRNSMLNRLKTFKCRRLLKNKSVFSVFMFI